MRIIIKLFAITVLFFGCFLNEPSSVYAETVVSITGENFCDSAFQKYVRDKIDTNGNGILEGSEQKAVKSISIHWSDYNVTNYKGIEFFTNLDNLYINAAYYPDDEEISSVSTGSVIALDLSQNTKIKRLICNASKIKGLNFSRLTELEEVRISAKHEQLDLSFNHRLRKIVMGNVRLTGKMKDLEEFNVKNADMADFDISASKKIAYLHLDSVKMKKLQLAGLTGLKEISCSSSEIPEIILDGIKSLVTVYLDSSKIEKLSVSGCVNLKNLRCPYNKLKELRLQRCHKL